MSDMVALYGFGGGGGTGATLTVTAPAGCTVTVSKDGKTKTKVAGEDGVAVFKGLETGEWTITMTDGEQASAPQTVTITADYATTITFFEATINVTYPSGSTCKATDSVTTLTAPDTSGTWECLVPNAGTWTVTANDENDSESKSVDITDDGQAETVELYYGNLISAFDGFTEVRGSGTNSGSMTVDMFENKITAVTTGINASNQGTVMRYSSKKIDLTPYSSIVARIDATGIGVTVITIQSGNTCSNWWSGDLIANAGGNIYLKPQIDVLLDVSEINESVYIGIGQTGSITDPNATYGTNISVITMFRLVR